MNPLTTQRPREINLQPGDDMAPIRAGVRQFCARHDFADFDAVNLLLTIKRTAHEFNRLTEHYCESVGLTPGRLAVLMVLNSQPETAFPLSQLGDHLVVTRANITGLVDGLVHEGLVRRVDHPDDRRMVLAQLTDKGRKFLGWFAPQHHENVKRFMRCLSGAEKRQLVGFLDKLRAHVRGAKIEKPKAR